MQNKKLFSKKGFTLVETIIAITLFLLGTQATVLVFAKTMKNKAYVLEMGKASFVVSRSMGDVTQYLRRARQSDGGAYPVVSAKNNDLVFYSDYDKDDTTERLHVYLVNNTVFLGVRDPSTSTIPVSYGDDDDFSNDEVFQLAEHIINGAGDPMFSYFNSGYPKGADKNPLDTTTAAAGADVSEVRLVKMFLKINIDPNRAPDNIQQETFIEIRNLNDYDRIR